MKSLFSLEEQFAVTDLKSGNMTKSNSFNVNHENHDNEKSSFRNLFKFNTMKIAKNSTISQTKCIDVSQRD